MQHFPTANTNEHHVSMFHDHVGSLRDAVVSGGLRSTCQAKFREEKRKSRESKASEAAKLDSESGPAEAKMEADQADPQERSC